jgi:hypothetical protein
MSLAAEAESEGKCLKFFKGIDELLFYDGNN